MATKAHTSSSSSHTRSRAKTARKSTSKARKPSTAQKCWPGFEPTPGKSAGTKGSCRKKPGKQPKSVRKADQKAAAASKLRKTGSR